jgi:hypothetical protein
MIRRVDRCWFRVLVLVSGWVDDRAQAHRRREMWRRFRRSLKRQRAELN